LTRCITSVTLTAKEKEPCPPRIRE
jgi:hypothetical protein